MAADVLVIHSAFVELTGDVSRRVPRPLLSVVDKLYVPSKLWFGASEVLLLMSSVPATPPIPSKLLAPETIEVR